MYIREQTKNARFRFSAALLIAASCLAGLQLAAFPAMAQKGKACEQDSDCNGKRFLCYEHKCTRLKKSEAVIRVRVVFPGAVGGSVYVDGTYRGEGPWEGVVEPGAHEVRVEAKKLLPYVKMVECPARQATEVDVSLQRDPAFDAPPPPPPPPIEETPPGRPKMLFAGLYGGGGIGTAQWGDDKNRRPAAKWQIGGTVGARLLEDPIWLDLAVAVSYSSFRVKDPPGADSSELQNGWTPPDLGAGAQFALQARLLFPIEKHFFYLGGELEPGYVYSEARYAYATLCPTASLFFGEWVEVRVSPIGLHWLQELTGAGFVAALYGTVGIVIRFYEP